MYENFLISEALILTLGPKTLVTSLFQTFLTAGTLAN